MFLILFFAFAAENRPEQIKAKRETPERITTEVMPAEVKDVKFNNYMKNWEAFLAKPDEKAFAVGEMTENLKSRPWAASWNHETQHQANFAAVAACRLQLQG